MSTYELTDRCKKLLAEGSRIAAIVALKEDLGIGLAEAMDCVEAEFAKYAGSREDKLKAVGLTRIVIVAVQDGLQLASGAFAPSSQRCEIFCRVFGDWVEGGELAAARVEAFYEYLYGATWRRGNEDGSRYLPVSTTCQLLSEEEKVAKPWGAALSSATCQYWFCHAKRNGSLERVDKSMF